MDRTRAAACVVGGTVLTVVGMFVPLVRLVAPALGGGLAGYAYDGGPRTGLKLGGAVAALSVAAFVTFGLVVFGVLALVGAALPHPEAFAEFAAFGGVVAVIWVVVVPLLTLVLAPAGGYAGGELAADDDVAGGEAG